VLEEVSREACSVEVVLSYSAGYLGKEHARGTSCSSGTCANYSIIRCQLLFPSNVPDGYILGKECTSAIHALAFVP
jgi:hypothetical protein